MKRISLLILAALFLSGVAYAQEEGGASFEEWDANDNGELSEQEFDTGFEASGLYDDWDANNDGMISEAEFGDNVYEGLDENNDNVLEEDEWEEGEEDGFWDI